MREIVKCRLPRHTEYGSLIYLPVHVQKANVAIKLAPPPTAAAAAALFHREIARGRS